MSASVGNPTKEARHRIFFVPAGELLEILNFATFASGEKPLAHRIVGLPADAYVSGVDYDYSRNCFCVRVDSMKFSPVRHGELIPEIPVTMVAIDPAKISQYPYKGLL